MKTFLFALFVALMLGISCSSSLGKVSVNEPEQDTVVRSVRDRSGWYCEFFVVTKQDTSAYSCIFDDEYSLNMSIHLSSERKFLDVTDNDTTVADTGMADCTDKYYIPTYAQWLREMELCFKSASKVYDLSRLSYSDAFLPYLFSINYRFALA